MEKGPRVKRAFVVPLMTVLKEFISVKLLFDAAVLAYFSEIDSQIHILKFKYFIRRKTRSFNPLYGIILITDNIVSELRCQGSPNVLLYR